jgi:uncharacterized LabA/DUF88 family protein
LTRIMVFIDGSNLYWAFKHWLRNNRQPPATPNIDKLVNLLVNNRELVRAYFFCSIKQSKTGEDDKTLKFITRLKTAGIDANAYPLRKRRKTFKCPKCKFFWKEQTDVEKGVDVALVTKFLALGFKGGYDTAIVVSGDADYVEAVKEVKNLGKRVEIAAFNDSAAKTLVEAADRFIPLDDKVNAFKLTSRRPYRPQSHGETSNH